MSDTTRHHDPTERTDPSAMSEGSPGSSAFRFEGGGDDSVAGLIKNLAEQGSHLAEQQLKLVEAEVRSGVADIKASAGAMAGAAVLGLAGLGVLLMGVSYLLAEAMPLWLATMIVGALTLGGAYAMFAAGKKKLDSSSLNVERTKRTLQRAPGAIASHMDKGSEK